MEMIGQYYKQMMFEVFDSYVNKGYSLGKSLSWCHTAIVRNKATCSVYRVSSVACTLHTNTLVSSSGAR